MSIEVVVTSGVAFVDDSERPEAVVMLHRASNVDIEYLSPKEARRRAAQILQAAETAESDLALWRWMDGQGGYSAQQKSALCQQIRKHRDDNCGGPLG